MRRAREWFQGETTNRRRVGKTFRLLGTQPGSLALQPHAPPLRIARFTRWGGPMPTTRWLAAAAALLLSLPAALMAQDPVPLYPGNYKVLVENDRVRVLDFRLRKGDHEEF